MQRYIREHAELLGYDLATDARGRWITTNGCTYLAAGVGQAIRGFRADLILIDDPIRSPRRRRERGRAQQPLGVRAR